MWLSSCLLLGCRCEQGFKMGWRQGSILFIVRSQRKEAGLLLSTGCRNSTSFPLASPNGRLWGVLGIFAYTVRRAQAHAGWKPA